MYRLSSALLLIAFHWNIVDGKDYVLEHRFSPNADYTYRGKLVCEISNTKPRCSLHNVDDIASLMSELSGHGFYFIRICDKEQVCLQTFMKQCLLIESNVQETMELVFSSAQHLISISLLSPLPHCNYSKTSLSKAASPKTKLEVIEMSSPPEPETAFFIKQVEEEKQRKEKGEGEDNRSFLAKYWMYIVPVVLVMLFMDKGEQQ